MNPFIALRKAVLRDAPRHHHGNDFTDLRPYTLGDDYRHIDWGATARMGELYSRVTRAEKPLTLATIVDTSASMRAGRFRPLSSAAEEARETWHRIGTPDDHHIDLSSNDIVAALERAQTKLPRGAALLVISDCFGFVPNGPSTLRLRAAPYAQDDKRRFVKIIRMAERFMCTLLFVRDPWYEGVPLRGFHRMRDIENNSTHIVFFGSRERERYRTAVRKREDTIIARCSAAGWRTGILTEASGADALFGIFNIL